MRTGACTVHQTLTSEAASVLKHSLSLARRRGHAQVTPLHVAATLLASKTSPLKRACLKSQPQSSHYHPLHCRALELCFNVALNRLPTAPSPLLHSAQPSLSNALIAALKRAQAHQRRGCIEQQNHHHQQQSHQNQPLLAAIKVELEQLILSILDDPSVSRVMREAGFSSTCVKSSLEDSSAGSPVFLQYYGGSGGGVYSTPNSPPNENHREIIFNPSSFRQTHFLNHSSDQNPFLLSPLKMLQNPDSSSVKQEDINLVMEVLMRKKRKNTVVIGDSASVTESFVSNLMSKIERNDVPEELKSTQFIKFHFSSIPLKFMKKEEVEINLSDLKRKVDSLVTGGRGVIIYTGDLKWTVEREGTETEAAGNGDYRAVDHIVGEIGKLVCEYGRSNARVWIMGSANFQTYMRCQMKQPPLEVQWGLQAVSVPSGGLGLSLNAPSVHDPRISFTQNPSQIMMERKPKEEQDLLICCVECTSNYEKEAAAASCNNKDMDKASNQLPYWLQSHSKEPHHKDDLAELRRKWNRLCLSIHQGRQGRNHMITHSSSSPPHDQWLLPSRAHIFLGPNSISTVDSPLNPNRGPSSVPRFRRQNSCHIEFNFSNVGQRHHPNLDSLKSSEGKEVKITLGLGNSLFSDPEKWDESKIGEKIVEIDLWKILQENVPWQNEGIDCVLGVLGEAKSMKSDCWMMIWGNDSIGKRRLARGIAKSLLGSDEFLISINMKTSGISLKNRCFGILDKALRKREKRLVVLVENVDFADAQFAKLLADAFGDGKFGDQGVGKKLNSTENVFILTKGESTMCKDGNKRSLQMKFRIIERTQKRKTEWELPRKSKNSRLEEKEEDFSKSLKKEFTRQLSPNTLDLNIRPEEEDEINPKTRDSSPNRTKNPIGFLDLIKNRFEFNRNSGLDSKIKENFLAKIKGASEEITNGDKKWGFFDVEEVVLEELVYGCGSFLNGLFEQWLKEIFQTSLVMVKNEEGVGIRLCLDGKVEKESDLGDGFMGSCLPKRIQVSSMD